jgi:SAM-dependent methyltransferase
MMLEQVDCNLCGSSDFRIRFEKRGHLTGRVFQVVECVDCALVYVNPRLPDEWIRALYNEAYFHGDGFDPYVRYEEELRSPADKDAWAARVMDRISTVKPPPADFLEIGPGVGHLLRMAKKRGYRAVGLELSGYAARLLRDHGLEILEGTIEKIMIPEATYDVIVAVELIEHLPDPRKLFFEVARILRPGGVFYYETGNIDCGEAQRLGAEWDYIRPEGHLYYFSPRTLTQFLEKAGLKARYPYWFNPTRRIVRVLEGLGLVEKGRQIFRGPRGALARAFLSVWDWPASRRPYPMGVRVR